MQRTLASETKLLICIWHPFSLWRPPAEFAGAVCRRWPEMKVVHLPTYDNLEKELPDTDIFVGFSIRPNQFALARKLKWIHSTAAGVGQLMFPELRRSGIFVTNVSGIHATPMAEHVLGVLITLARRFPDCFRGQREVRWLQQKLWDAPVRPRDFYGETLLLVGLGAVGKEVARLVRPLGMKIWAVTRSGRGDSQLVDRILPASEFERVLPEADFVVLCAPETPESRHMIGARQLAAMKPSAYLINVARGTLIDEAALAGALSKQIIAGAALDVTEEEPLPPESPLWKLDNLFLTPHMSGASESLWPRQTELLLENLERWLSGRELINRVDLERGY